MRRRALSLMALLLIAGSVVLPATSQAGQTKPQTHRYEAPWGMRYSHWWDSVLETMPERPPLVFEPTPGARSVTFTLKGDDGRTVYALVSQRPDRGKEIDPYYFCGNHIALDLETDTPLEVKVYVGACDNHLVATGKSGSVSARFSNRSAPSIRDPHRGH